MAKYIATNNAYSTLAGGVLIGATSLSVQAGHGDRFPEITGSDWTFVTLQDASNNIEIVKVTARAALSDTMTVVRAQEGTSARAWNAGDVVECRPTAGITVTTDGEQTLTNKTVKDASFTIQDDADPTKQFRVQVSGVTAGQTRTMTVPDADFTAVGVATTQTLTNKTALALTNTIEARSGPDTSPFNFRNLLHNPRGEVYQRSIVSTADDTYFADRWYALTQTGAVTPSTLSAPEDGYHTAVRLTQAQAAAQRFGFAQIVEGKDCKSKRGGSATLVPRVRISNSQAIRYAILGWTGTEDSVTSDVVNDWTSGTYTAGNFFLGANLSVLGVGAQTPSANTWTSLTALTASLGSAFNNLIVMVWTEGTAAQNVTLDFDYVQLEPGQTATPPEYRPFGIEMALCRRFLPTIYGRIPGIAGQCVATTQANYLVRFDVPARTVPTGIAFTDGHTNSDYIMTKADGTTTSSTGVSLSLPSTHGAALAFTGAAGLVAGDASYLIFSSVSVGLIFTGCDL